MHLAKSLVERDALDFVVKLFSALVNKPKSDRDTITVIDILLNFTHTTRELKRQQKLVVEIENMIEKAKGNLKDGPFAYKEFPIQLKSKVLQLFDEWLHLYNTSSHTTDDKSTYPQFIQELQQGGFYGSKDVPSEAEIAFYRVSIETAIERCFTDQAQTPQQPADAEDKGPKLNYKAVDGLAKLFALLVKYFPDKVFIFKRILDVIATVIERYYLQSPLQFDQRPYFRLCANLLMEFSTPDPIFESHLLYILLEFRDLFHRFRPTLFPAFTVAWLELISHRMFMPKLLKDHAEGWPPMLELFLDLFRFLEPYLRKAELLPHNRILYQGTLRVLLVLLHDFPEFLCDYHFSFCTIIPPTCIQMRNLILSAFPRTMKLPDPFTPNLKVDLLPEIKEPPKIRSPYLEPLIQQSLKTKLDNFLRTAEPTSFLTELTTKLLLPATVVRTGTKYNIPLINSLVLAVGTSALLESVPENSPQAPMEIFRFLSVNLDTEGRYYLFNAIANQLRFPNNHTHYFSCVLLFLFAESTLEIVQEQITRVLVERLIAHRPHPWGLLITFIELIKNPRYNFWNRSFTRCAPEIERLFFQVGNSIAQHKSEQ